MIIPCTFLQGKVDGKQTGLQDKLREAKNENAQLKTRIRQLESEIKSGGGGGGGSVGADVSKY